MHRLYGICRLGLLENGELTMAFEYGFYNSVDHDRLYENRQLSEMFNGIILDGVFKYYPINGSNANNNRYMITRADGMSIYVGTGMAWFKSTWTLNTEKIRLTLSGSDQNKDRYDLVALEIRDARANSISVIEGKPSSNPVKPTPISEEGLHQYPLAYIMVRAGVTEITDNDIENMVGTEATPYVKNIAEDIYNSSVNRLDVTEYGYILDARQGKVLNDKITAQNATISSINSGTSSQTNYIESSLKSTYNGQKIPFKFGVSGSGSNQKYGYYELQNGKYVFVPFVEGKPEDNIVNLGKLENGRYDASIKYPDLYQQFTVRNFFVRIKKMTLSNSLAENSTYHEKKHFTNESGNLWWQIHAAVLNALRVGTLTSYDNRTGIFTISSTGLGPVTANISYSLGEGTSPGWGVYDSWDATISLSIDDYDVYLLAGRFVSS